MRPFWMGLVLAALLGGCLSADPSPQDADAGALVLRETYDGALTTARAGPLAQSPDQLGMAHREFSVPADVARLELHLVTTGGELEMSLHPPGCDDETCAEHVRTEAGEAMHVIQAPAEGAWRASLVTSEDDAGEIAYSLHVAKTLRSRQSPEQEVREGSVVAAHAGAVRISPDQLGDVYREFWVHEDTHTLRVLVEAEEDLEVVLGQSKEGRDAESEEGYATEGGKLEVVIDDPQAGGWYVILFHPTEGPGAREVAYRVDITKEWVQSSS